MTVSRDVLRAIGVPAQGPTLIGTDNYSNMRVATGEGCPSRSRHFLRRYHVLRQRIATGDVIMRHVKDEDMPADCLTKWIPNKKLEKSLTYLCNTFGRAAMGAAEDAGEQLDAAAEQCAMAFWAGAGGC